MEHNLIGLVARAGESKPARRELLSRRVTGFVSLIIVYLVTLLFGAVMTEPYLFPRSAMDYIGTAYLLSSAVCFLWGVLILRTCLRWGLFCVLGSLLSLVTLGLHVIHYW
jgi:hypothetical protein